MLYSKKEKVRDRLDANSDFVRTIKLYRSKYKSFAHSIREGIDIVVDCSDHSKEQHSCKADAKCPARIIVASERGCRRFVRVNVHCLDNKQIIIKRNDSIDQGDQD